MILFTRQGPEVEYIRAEAGNDGYSNEIDRRGL